MSQLERARPTHGDVSWVFNQMSTRKSSPQAYSPLDVSSQEEDLGELAWTEPPFSMPAPADMRQLPVTPQMDLPLDMPFPDLSGMAMTQLPFPTNDAFLCAPQFGHYEVPDLDAMGTLEDLDAQLMQVLDMDLPADFPVHPLVFPDGPMALNPFNFADPPHLLDPTPSLLSSTRSSPEMYSPPDQPLPYTPMSPTIPNLIPILPRLAGQQTPSPTTTNPPQLPLPTTTNPTSTPTPTTPQAPRPTPRPGRFHCPFQLDSNSPLPIPSDISTLTPRCTQPFKDTRLLNRHLRAKHDAYAEAHNIPSEKARCTVCGMEGRRDNMARHMETKAVIVSECGIGEFGSFLGG
ncbi:hypothetical protein B0J18DRAFT_62463 [Chaetomium sp. MPI-SDFR-AT-0129]|nr:hypothetical protein B0J18DRAFT_62463 [Chaetomium sp. MPI-SDFR-AT-0129]